MGVQQVDCLPFILALFHLLICYGYHNYVGLCRYWWLCTHLHSPQYFKDIFSINLNEVEINTVLVNPMCFPMLFHDPLKALNDCLNLKKYEY